MAQKPNTGASQGFLGTLKSFAPGGQKANFGALSRNAVNFAGEVSGAYDIKRGAQQIAKSGILPGGKKADFGQFAKGIGQIGLGAISAVPVVGGAARGVTAGLRAAKLVNTVNKESKFIKAAQAVEKRVMTPVIRPKAVTPAATRTGRAVQAVARAPKSLTSAYGLATVAAPVVGGLVSGIMAGTRTPGYTSPYGTPTGPVQGPGLGGRDQNLSTTVGGGATGGGNAGSTGGSAASTTAQGSAPQTPVEVMKDTTAAGDAAYAEAAGGSPSDYGFQTSGDIAGANIMTGGGTASTGGSAQAVGVPGAVQVANADYLANLAALGAQSYGRQAGFREAMAQGVEGAQGSAADIIGGRSQAILGQALTGVRRGYQTNMAAEVQRQVAEQEASRKAYSDAVAQAYSNQAQSILDAAQKRAAAAAQIRQIG